MLFCVTRPSSNSELLDTCTIFLEEAAFQSPSWINNPDGISLEQNSFSLVFVYVKLRL